MAQPTAIQRLIAHKMSLEAIPPGGSFIDGARFLLDPQRLSASAKAAREWVAAAILVVRSADEPNPWKDASDEVIAAEILRQVEAKPRSEKER